MGREVRGSNTLSGVRGRDSSRLSFEYRASSYVSLARFDAQIRASCLVVSHSSCLAPRINSSTITRRLLRMQDRAQRGSVDENVFAP
jgi:hypothetical protein